MILFMMLLLVLARDNGMIISPLCWVLFGFYALWRFMVLLLTNAKDWEE